MLGIASKGLDSVRERAKTASDVALKENISKLYNDFLDLKGIILRLTEENADLRQQLADKPAKLEIRQVGDTNYYYLGEEGPYCQPCYDVKDKLIPLTPKQEFAGGMGRQCRVCNNTFFEVPRRTPISPVQRKPYSGGWS